MDNIEITVFDEIKDYKEKIYFFNFRQWIFAILIAILVIPTYILLKDKIGEEVTSYIVIAIAGVLGFIGFVKIHELPAEQIMPYWFRHYFLFAKPIHYMSDEEYRLLHEKKKKRKANRNSKKQSIDKKEIKELRKKQKQEKLLMKAKKKYGITENTEIIRSNETKEKIKTKDENNNYELVEKLSKLTKEEQEILLKLLGR
ncbi:MAG: PrgI family protein [Bacilli bacterium]